MKHAIILAILLLSGCRLEPADTKGRTDYVTAEAIVTYSDDSNKEIAVQPGDGQAQFDGVTVEHFGHTVRVNIDRAWRDSLRAELRDVNANRNQPELPQTAAAAKVAAVMAANDITLPQVAAWLNAYGFDVINRAEFREWTWTPAPAGTNPIAYYIANFRVATGSNSLRVYLPQTAGPYWIRVKAYDGTGLSGPWSMTSTSAGGGLLPGVAGE